ncbi:MAG: 2Fe-2S iron-sulfur cluster binding domain-containing protein [Candidatus Ruthia sp.]|jgi:CDP-4-dehydro-6-deoxyglucose reductase, E3|nr:2Fe-2S iron-sulfur cluster binding domain-containing protein [Candidatus Ruthturnera sp.]MBT4123051.1 2Fe-2S iron-sulfur cluster binding domain-containing protein [Candidatus Ruthturnera sp.]MBT6922680.1 2Fe-2S iron-sulfur cluster binding domain-containing protein [Candidatus Ruthturnera sp.]
MSNQIFNIQLKNNKRNFECSENDSVLEGGLRYGLAMRYECSNGTCGACVAKLIDGDIKQIKHHDFSLSDEQKNQGEFLMCCNAPASDLNLKIDLIGDVKSIPIQNIETKVKKVSFVNDDLAIITLRTPRSKTLQFMAGQDVELSFKGKTSRYPLASCPCHGMELEFHIRNMPEDAFATSLFTKKIKSKSVIDLEGPKGIFVLKETSKRPMTFIAWDSGFAPIRSLVEHAFSLEMPNPVNFYWAYPADEQVPYLDNHAKSWQAIMDNYTYIPIACEFDRSSKNDCHKVAKQIFDALDLNIINQSDLYLCAPAEVLIYLGELLLENGLNEARLIASPI